MSRRLAAVYAAVTLILAYPLSLHPASTLLSTSPDADLFMWTLAWDAHAFVTHPFRIFDANIYHPHALTLAYSENLIGSALLAAPVLWITHNPVLAMNAVALVSSVLCGLGACLLGRRAGLGTPASVICGLVFAFSPPRFLRLDQLHLVALQWIPFTLAFVHAYLDTGRRRDARLAAACFTLQVLSSGHGAVFAALAAALLVLWRLAWGQPFVPGRWARDLGWAGALALVAVALAVLPYVAIQREMGLRRTLEDWSVPASSFLASPAHAQVALLGWLLPGARINETAGAYLFPGVLALVCALAAWMPSPARSRLPGRSRGFYALLTLTSLWLAAGPPIGLWPFVYWMPGLNFIRAPSRFILLAVLGLAVLAGMGVERLLARVRRPRLAALAVGGLLVAEFAAMPLGVEAYRVDIPPIDRWLATQAPPFVVAEVPLPDSRDLNRRERRQTLFMLHATAHWQKTVHGYSGLRPPEHDALYRDLLRFPDDASLDQLARFGVTRVVVHGELYEPGEWPAVDAKLRGYANRLRLLHEEAGARVYALVGR